MCLLKSKIKRTVYFSSLLAGLLSFTACDKAATPEEVANRASSVGACLEAETYIHDVVQKSFEEAGSIPSGHDVLDAFKDVLNDKPELNSLQDSQKEELLSSFNALYVILEGQIDQSVSTQETLDALGKLEFGLHPDEELQKSYTEAVAEYRKLSLSILKNCTPPTEEKKENDTNDGETDDQGDDADNTDGDEGESSTPAPPVEASDYFEELKQNTENPSHFGALKTFSVAYQSCEAISIDALTKSDEDLNGVSVVGRHSSGRGNKREITSMSKLLRTHPYVKDYRQPASSCVDSTKNPLIYDFGGKPYATSDVDSSLNFFRNFGTGSKELGVDCSGYVYSALMTAGLKLAPDKPLRARNVTRIPARAYMNPGSSMSCIQKVKAGTGMQLQGGDIFASTGHIFMVVSLGDDPLGVQEALKKDSCSSITYKDFDFTIMQSSPSKGAIGMNHMEAVDYLSESTTMRKGFEKFARLDCENKQKGKLRTPSIDEAVLTRHKMTPECMDSDYIKLENESCVKRCSLK